MNPANHSGGSPSTYESCESLWRQPLHLCICESLCRQLSRCYRDSQCGGPVNSDPPVAGRCQSGKCVCPAPWAGAKCDTLQQCMFHSDVYGGWTNHSCGVDLLLTTADYFACRCGVAGTYKVLVIEASQQPLAAKPVIGISPLELADTFLMLEAALEDSTPLLMLAAIDAVWLLFILASKRRCNESRMRKHIRYNDLWRQQHTLVRG
jgi:hypothetical protein